MKVRADLAGGQALGIQRQHHLIHTRQPPLPLPDDLRLEGPVPVPRDLDTDLAGGLGQHRLGPGAIAHVPGLIASQAVLVMTEMLGQLLVQRRFQHRLGQLLQQPIRASQRQALLPGPGHQLLGHLLLSGRLPLALLGHIVQCRVHHGTSPAGHQARRDRAGNTVRSTVPIMGEASPRRGHGDDSIYFDRANHSWVGAVSLGHKAGRRVRRKVTARTKTEVKDKLRKLRRELDSGVRSSASYTVSDALEDWLASGLNGRSDRTVELYRDTVKPLRERLGEVKLRDLTAGDVQQTLDALAGRLSTRTLQILRNCLERAIRHAEIRDLTGRNVAALVKAPRGRPGRPSKSLTLEQAHALVEAARDSRLYAYVVLSVMTGLRTEELRALRWSEVDLDACTVAVYRAVRATGDTKTQKSRRVLLLPQLAVEALREHHKLQAADRLKAGRCGRIMAWSSRRRSARSSIVTTCAASFGRSLWPLALVTAGRRGSCGTPSCRCSPPTGCRSKT